MTPTGDLICPSGFRTVAGTRRLAAILFTDITRLLTGRGVLRCVPYAFDHRSTLLVITPKGERVYREAWGGYRSYFGQLNRSRSSEEREELERGPAEML
jgi:hypothetical protein